MVHRDLKPENILLDEKEKRKINAVLCDFGFSMGEENSQPMETTCGTPVTMAPELQIHDRYNNSVDLWALGTILYKMCFGHYPFRGKNLKENIKKGKYFFPEKFVVSLECLQCINGCLQEESRNRLIIL